MSYEVIARKWRPQRFSELVGQEHISRTLKNAIARQRVAHAYLFVGSRGVGKTTSARLFAKSLNCTDLQDGEPCCECQSCIEIAAGNSLDVIEIDGASNNGVDDIRDLRENVQYTPTTGNYKIYIIDEVHMLTSAAWNALLKTLEEPPPHVKFIFATTEAHKVLPTVISRCQRFDFKQIPPVLIVKKLREIADGEGVFIDDNALSAIARAADGGMRDAQSIFDQIIAFCSGASADEMIYEKHVIDVFGMASSSELVRLVQCLLQDNVSELMTVINQFAKQGKDLDRLFADMLSMLRNLMIIQACSNANAILEIDSSEIEALDVLSKFPAEISRRLLESLMQVEGRMRMALNKRVFIEVSLIRAMREAHQIDMDSLIKQFQTLSDSNLPRPAVSVESVSQPTVPEKKTDDSVSSAETEVQHQQISTEPNDVSASIDQNSAVQPPEPTNEFSESATNEVVENFENGPSQQGIKEARNLNASEPPSTVDTTVETTPNSNVEAVNVPEVVAEPAAESPAETPEMVSENSVAPTENITQFTPQVESSSVEDVNNFAVPASQFAQPPTVTEVVIENGFVEGEVSHDQLHTYETEEVVEQTFYDEPAVEETEITFDESQASVVIQDASDIPPAQSITQQNAAELWDSLINEVAKIPSSAMLTVYMKEVRPVAVSNGVLTAEFTDDFPEEHYELIVNSEHKSVIDRCLQRLTGLPDAHLILARGSDNFQGDERILESSPEVRRRVMSNEFVKQLMQTFGGELIDVRG